MNCLDSDGWMGGGPVGFIELVGMDGRLQSELQKQACSKSSLAETELRQFTDETDTF